MEFADAAFIVHGVEPAAFGSQPGRGWEQEESALAERYESEIVEQARAIAAGASDLLPSREHLQVLLSWLDGPQAPRPEPFIPTHGAPF